jgi:20S proteasome subunit alpha 3
VFCCARAALRSAAAAPFSSPALAPTCVARPRVLLPPSTPSLPFDLRGAAANAAAATFLPPTAPTPNRSHTHPPVPRYKLDDHIGCVVAGLTADANLLIGEARVMAQRHLYTYQEPMPVEQLVKRVCDLKHSYTQFGSLRPFGVSFLVAGHDKYLGHQLYMSDPSGNFSAWKATCIGKNNPAGKSLLKSDYTEGASIQECLKLAAKVMNKTMDTTAPSAEKIEFFTLTRDAEGNNVHTILPDAEVTALLAAVELEGGDAGDE